MSYLCFESGAMIEAHYKKSPTWTEDDGSRVGRCDENGPYFYGNSLSDTDCLCSTEGRFVSRKIESKRRRKARRGRYDWHAGLAVCCPRSRSNLPLSPSLGGLFSPEPMSSHDSRGAASSLALSLPLHGTCLAATT